MITIQKQCPFTGKFNSMELPMTEAEFSRAQAARANGALIQDAFPMLNADQREFILTGITPDKWEDLFT